MSSKNEFYVYFHINLLKNKVFYVGKGKGNRAYCKKSRNNKWSNTIKKYPYSVFIVNSNLIENEAFKLEMFYISHFGLKNLCNISPGGNGGDTISNNPNRKEIIKKMSEKAKGCNNPNFESKFKTEDYLKKQSLSNSKVNLKCENVITGEIIYALNSKDLAIKIDAKPSNVRMCKNKYLLKHKYKITTHINL